MNNKINSWSVPILHFDPTLLIFLKMKRVRLQINYYDSLQDLSPIVTITMVTGFLPSLLTLMEGLEAHWSVNKDRDDGC